MPSRRFGPMNFFLYLSDPDEESDRMRVTVLALIEKVDPLRRRSDNAPMAKLTLSDGSGRITAMLFTKSYSTNQRLCNLVIFHRCALKQIVSLVSKEFWGLMYFHVFLERVTMTDAKIEALTLDVQKLQGDMESVKETVFLIDKRLDHQLMKIAKHEEEIFVLKQHRS